MVAIPVERYCIIGAGASGLAVAKVFAGRGIPFDLLEREPDLGGLWNIATKSGIVYDSTHLVSAITTTSYADLPITTDGPGSPPDYPSHAWVLDYLRSFAQTFDLTRYLQTSTRVEAVTRRADGAWDVKVAGEAAPRRYAGVVVANGHHDLPRRPTYPGQFTGEMIHSRDYKSQRQVRDKRVLVVGAGNSACDIVKDAAHVSGHPVVMSMRRGTWFVPKFILGFPTGDVLANVEWWLKPAPRAIKAYLFQATLWVLQGPPSRYKLPDPTHRIDKAHPTMSDDVPRLVAHGRIIPKPAIERLDGRDVVFTDGSRVTADMIVLATGYELSIPFLDQRYYLGANGKPRLYLNTANPDYPGLFFAGLIQANGSIWRLAALQGEVIANAIVARRAAPEEAAAFQARAVRQAVGVGAETFVASDRHKLEANYFDYARALRSAARAFPRARSQRFSPGGAAAVAASARHQAAE